MQPDSVLRLVHAEAWLSQARRDSAVVERILGTYAMRNYQHLPESPESAVYMLQQAVEKAAKSLMFAAGENEDTLRRRYGHNSLIAVLEFIRQRFRNQTYTKMFDVLSGAHSLGVRNAEEALGATDDLMRKARSKDLLDLAVLSPDAMGEMVGLLTKIREQTVSVSRRLIRPRVSVKVDASRLAESSATEYILAVATAAMQSDQLAPEAVTKARTALESADLDWINAWKESKESEVTISRERLMNDVILPLSWTFPALYMLAALTFPHEATARYPAPWDAPNDAIEAARCGKLGTIHYTRSLGVVDKLPQLHRLTKTVLENMRPLLVHAIEYSTDFN